MGLFLFFYKRGCVEMQNPPKLRKNGVNEPVTRNVIGYIWETQAINTKK